MGQSDLEDFTDAQDSQDWLSTLTKSENKVRELQSLLIAKSKQGKDQVAELQPALDREKLSRVPCRDLHHHHQGPDNY